MFFTEIFPPYNSDEDGQNFQLTIDAMRKVILSA